MTHKNKPRPTRQQITFQDVGLYELHLLPRTAAGDSPHQTARAGLTEFFALVGKALKATPVSIIEAHVILDATDGAEGAADTLPLKVERYLRGVGSQDYPGVQREAFRERLMGLSPWQLYALEDAARRHRIARADGFDGGLGGVAEFFEIGSPARLA